MESRLDDINKLGEALDALSKQITMATGRRQGFLERLKKMNAEMDDLSSQREVMDKSKSFLEALSDEVRADVTGFIESLVSKGLQNIFNDQDLSFIITYQGAGSSTGARFRIIDSGKELPLIGSVGGGVIEVTAFLLRIAVVYLSVGKAGAIIVCDEPLSRLSERYVERAAAFIKYLTNNLDGIQLLIVTHKPALAELGDKIYRTTQEDGQAVFEVINAD